MKSKERSQAANRFSLLFIALWSCCLSGMLMGCFSFSSERKVHYYPIPVAQKTVAQKIEEASKSLVTQLVQNLPINKKLRVAVMPAVDYTGEAYSLVPSLGESLKTALVRSTRFDVIEDGDMRKVMHQLHIQEQERGLLDESTIQRMGKMLAAEAILVGTITDLNDDFGVNFRIVPIESGVVASAGTVSIRKADFVRRRTIYYSAP